jgi:hypothetical protein
MFKLAFAAAIVLGTAQVAAAQSEVHEGRATQFLPIENEPPPELLVDPPLPGPLARGAVIIPYRTKHFRILPVFGAGAVDVSPRAGHLHVSVDDLTWRWADAGNNESVVVVGLAPGPHKILIELATPEHEVLVGRAVAFVIPLATAPGPEKAPPPPHTR